MKGRTTARRLLHLAATLLAAVLALQLVPWEPAARLFPSLSPLLALGGALAGRAFWPAAALSLPILVAACFRRRWFCYHLCPTGYCAEAIGKLNPRAANRFSAWPRLGGWLALLMVGGAAAGSMLAPWLDPLSLFNGFVSAWPRPPEWTWAAVQSLVADGLPPLMAGFLVILLVSLLRPHLWCLRLCPLGGLQDTAHELVQRLRNRRAADDAAPKPERRLALGLLAGGAAALLVRRRAAAAVPVVRPPGAIDESAFTRQCARCGACLKACRYRILVPDLGGAGTAGLLAPRLDFTNGYCHENCRACTDACPTGAIRSLTLPEKRRFALGTAGVARGRCLAWHDGAWCMLCHASCPYEAIEAEEFNGVECPIVKPDRCRGCGACEQACPASPKAIRVDPAGRRMLPVPATEDSPASPPP